MRRAPGEVQIGTDSRWAVRVSGLTDRQADRFVTAGDRPLDARLPAPALDLLHDAGLLRAPPRSVPRIRAELAPEAVGYGLSRANDGNDDSAVLRRRDRAAVGIVGLDRLGITVAGVLAAAGVGTILLDDPGTVRAGEVGGGVGAEDVGQDRTRVAASVLRRQNPRVRVTRRGAASPDVVVTVATDAADPGTALDLMTAEIAHLPVVVREADVVVGPFVDPRPRATSRAAWPCLRCVDLHRAELDPAWPVVLSHLTARHQPTATGLPAALAAVAGGLAAAEVLAHLDGDTPVTLGAQYEIPLPSVEPRLRRWVAHPECGCATLAS